MTDLKSIATQQKKPLDPAIEQAIQDCVSFCVTETKIEEPPPNSLTPREAIIARKRAEFDKTMRDFYHSFSAGYSVIRNALQERGGQDAELFSKNRGQLAQLEDLRAIQAKLNEGKTLSELLGLTADSMGTLYTIAYQLYEANELQKAKDAFFFLSQLNPYQPQFELGLGLSYCRLQAYDEAIKTLLHTISLDPLNTDCYLACLHALTSVRDFEQAKKVCDDAMAYVREHQGDPRSQELEAFLQEAKEHLATKH